MCVLTMAVVVSFDSSWTEESVYRFRDASGREYYLDFGESAKSVAGLSPDFFDKMFEAKRIVVDFRQEGPRRRISRIVSYK